jgi:predicted lactoylglutathione lyase
VDKRISLITLGVDDVTRSRTFYERLGWRGQEVEETVFIDASGIVLVLWSREKLAEDCGLPDHRAGGFGGFTLAHNVRSDAEVDAILTDAEMAGATISKPAAKTFYGGYAGVFVDPDGHCWEVSHNPGFSFADDGSIVLPDFG